MKHITTYLVTVAFSVYVFWRRCSINPIYRNFCMGVLLVALVGIHLRAEAPGPPLWP